MTQLQVAQPFPACVTRQVVVHRIVFSLSPLEAGVDAICQWCAVLFRTAVATSGQAILQLNTEPGIGTDAAKVVADCIHSSNVKAIGIYLLSNAIDQSKDASATDFAHDYDRLTDDESRRLRVIVARLIVVFIELLHLLIVLNREQLLDIIQARKRGEANAHHPVPWLGGKSTRRSLILGRQGNDRRSESRDRSSVSERSRNLSRPATGSYDMPGQQYSFPSTALEAKERSHRSSGLAYAARPLERTRSTGDASLGLKVDSAIAVQSELQRAFIALCKILRPLVKEVLQEETPRWLKNCALDNYFSSGTYRLSRISIAEELSFDLHPRMPVPDAAFVSQSRRPGDSEVASAQDSVGESANSAPSRSSRDRGSFALGVV